MEHLDEEDVLDPNPDIHTLFCHYNSLYFDDSLAACSVTWSSSRMTGCAGLCRFQPRGGCEIQLSVPLLKFRPTADLKNTLLHEMIHAFLWIENKNRDHSDHGPNFQKLMNDINCSYIDDHQRPAGGYNVTVYHGFHAEVENYQVNKWMCEDCGDVISRALNRAPSVWDCIEKVKHGGPCGNPCCHWHQHEKFCLGSYNKIAEPPGYEGKGSKGRNKHQNDGPKESSSASRNKAARTHKAGDNKDKSYVKRSRTITKFFPVVDTGNLDVDNSSSNDSSQKHLRDDSSKAIVIKLPDDMVPGQIARDVRSHASGKKRKFTDVSKKFYGHGKKYTVMSGWLDWYAEEESYKDIEPLINKRTERRKKQKIFTNSKRKVIEDKTMADASQRKGVDLKIVRSIDPAAPSGDRGANWCRVPGFCRDMDRRDLAADDVVPHLNHSSKVNILEISDD